MVLYKWEVSPSSGLDQIECQFAVCEACQRVTSQFGAIRGVNTMWRLRQLTACPEQHEPSRSPLRLLRNMSLPSPGWSCKLTSFLSFAPPVCFVLASCRASARFPLHVSSQVEQLATSGDRTDESGQRSTTAAGRDSRDMTHKADAANAKRRTMNSSCIWWPLTQACSATAARSCTGRREFQGSRQDSGPSDHGEVNQGEQSMARVPGRRLRCSGEALPGLDLSPPSWLDLAKHAATQHTQRGFYQGAVR